MVKIQNFLCSDENVFILQGYAGSGKTTLLKGIVNYLQAIQQQYQLMAPTGRAAKVINQKTGFEATTIHKGIYSFSELEEIEIKEEEKSDLSIIYYYKLRNNTEAYNTMFLVDEASMVSDTKSQGEFFRFGSGYLLKDLIEYSHINLPNSTSKIIFIGDPAQLPPIGMNFSPALDKEYLNEKYKLKIVDAEIKEVKRQNADNYILNSATKIRKCLTSGFFNNFDLRENGKDIFNTKYDSFLETYKIEKGTKVIISYKNKTALALNRTIRRNKYGADLPIQSSDIIIIGGNNYRLGVMNGEFGVVSSVEKNTIKREVRFYKKNRDIVSVELQWRQIELLMPDEQNQSKKVKGYMLENYLNGDNNLKPEEQQALYIDFKNRNPKLKLKTEKFIETIKTDPYFNCVLLKYGYAVTCHKAQGGEWDSTFVFWDKGVKSDFDFYNSEHNCSGKTNSEFYRWAYTAITRASKKLYCINPPCFNSFSGMFFIDAKVQNSFKELTGQSVKPLEIEVASEDIKLLKEFDLDEAPISFQDHFLWLNHLVQKQGINIVLWKKVNYEVRYGLKRVNDTASIKFWINGKNEFKSNFQKLPSETNLDSLYEEITKLISGAPSIVFIRNTVDTIHKRIDFELELEEGKPFLKSLFDYLQSIIADSGISITEINHQNYRERYTFEKGYEKAVIDFEYNGNGFFGMAIPLEKKCNSIDFLNRIIKAISNHKIFDYAI